MSRAAEVAQAINEGKWNTVNPVKSIDFSSGQFVANGTTYYLETHITIARYCEFVILQRELAMGMTLQEVYDGHIKQRQALNQMKFVEAAVFVDKLINHAIKLKEKEPTVLKICTLAINTKDEDRTKWDNDLLNSKFTDWKKEGININDFFDIALIIVPFFLEIYNNFTLDTIQKLGMSEEIISAATMFTK